jgi:hypothetical protein
MTITSNKQQVSLYSNCGMNSLDLILGHKTGQGPPNTLSNRYTWGSFPTGKVTTDDENLTLSADL